MKKVKSYVVDTQILWYRWPKALLFSDRIKCRSLMWAKECEEGSVVIATHKLTTQKGCDLFCSRKDLCKTFIYNTESHDCGLTTAMKAGFVFGYKAQE